MSGLSELLTQLQHGIERRLAAETELRQTLSEPTDEIRALQSQLTATQHSRDETLRTLAENADAAIAQATRSFAQQLDAAETAFRDETRRTSSEAARALADVEKRRDDSQWVVNSVLDDGADDSPAREMERYRTLLQRSRQDQASELAELNLAIQQVLDDPRWAERLPHEPENPPQDRESASQRFTQAVAAARQLIQEQSQLLLPWLTTGWRGATLFFLSSLLTGAAVFFLVNPEMVNAGTARWSQEWILAAAIAGGGTGLLLTLALFGIGVSKRSSLLSALHDTQAEAAWAHQHWLQITRNESERQQQELQRLQRQVQKERQDALKRYQAAHAQQVAEIESSRDARLAETKSTAHATRTRLEHERDQALARLTAERQQTLDQARSALEQDIQAAEGELHRWLSEVQRRQSELASRLKAGWEESWRQFETGLNELRQHSLLAAPDWKELSSGQWAPPRIIPDAIPLGDLQIQLDAWPGAISEDPRLAPRVSELEAPYEIAFPASLSTLFNASSSAPRKQAIEAIQGMLLRLLCRIPPGKLRFTIIDPLGLGESFGGFMHLADYDELLVTNRIWTEANQIESRLADLTEHMENVLQKYLRNEFATLEEYNRSAGEVAEPYHVLVINDFPAKFSEIAARRLVSIVRSGPRCGVYTLLIRDPAKTPPNNFEIADLRDHMTRLEWTDDAFHLASEPQFAQWPLKIAPPPPPDQFTSIVKMVGNASKDSRRVEVSFDRISPDQKGVWAGDSRREIEVPLGRAGATKLQRLRLGKGTSQHMLVAGKTGSGKSTFLHILITNLALHYSPDEINFYLIDFKKGVEFKPYAERRLPHARVIAIESDREFGVSVLTRLDELLQERGELFRKHSVQDIAGYRDAVSQPMPRVLLIVDEFQEFFVEDDKLGQSAALLLDRLVRQGRAFGIHVILGSQTLGGAYTLARSTLGQVAVRVALQCSEADAHLILSEENTAARLLSRPGEAIYNDANGLVEGNHPFQIAWLTDQQRDAALTQIADRSFRRGWEGDPPIVFEGNIPSHLDQNSLLSRLVDSFSERTQPILSPTIWLGDSVQIGPPAEVTFHRQSAQNLLIVGQDAEGAQGVLAAALCALRASQSPGLEQPHLFLFDGSHTESPGALAWDAVLSALGGRIERVRQAGVKAALERLSLERQRREAEQDHAAPPIFLIVDNIARFRDLRRADDDFGLGGFGNESPVTPAKQFSDLLLHGPAVGMHAIIWCDSYNNVDRWFSRQTLKELELRVAFQMNASDSSQLIDSPAASRLGVHRALLYREETGTAEKFRPYGVPEVKWLENLQVRLLHGPLANFATDLEQFSIL